MQNSLNIIFITLGTFIGAGFASGKEVFTFFAKYGIYGFLGILITTFLLVLAFYKINILSLKNPFKTYSEIVYSVLPKKSFLAFFLVDFTNIFLLISFITMISGFTAFCTQEFNISRLLGTTLVILISFLTLIFDISGIKKANFLLVPFIIVFIIILFFKKGNFQVVNPQRINCLWAIISSILYFSYNSIILVPTIINSKLYTTKKIISITSICFGLIFLVILSAVFLLLTNELTIVKNLDIPIIYVSASLGKFYTISCIFMLLSSIFTSILSAAYSFLHNITKSKKQYFAWLVIICILGFASFFIDFSCFIEYIYPLCGIFGLLQIFFLLKS